MSSIMHPGRIEQTHPAYAVPLTPGQTQCLQALHQPHSREEKIPVRNRSGERVLGCGRRWHWTAVDASSPLLSAVRTRFRAFRRAGYRVHCFAAVCSPYSGIPAGGIAGASILVTQSTAWRMPGGVRVVWFGVQLLLLLVREAEQCLV